MINEDFVGTLLPNIYIDNITISDTDKYNKISIKYSFLETLSDKIFTWSDLPVDALRNIKIAFRVFLNEEDKETQLAKVYSTGRNGKAIFKSSSDVSIADLFFSKNNLSNSSFLQDSIFDLLDESESDPSVIITNEQALQRRELINSAKGNMLKQYSSVQITSDSSEILIPKYLFLDKLELIAFIYYDFENPEASDVFGRPVHVKIIKDQLIEGKINRFRDVNNSIYYGEVTFTLQNRENGEQSIIIFDNEDDKNLIKEEFIDFSRITDIRINKLPQIITLVEPPKIIRKEKYFSKIFSGLTQTKKIVESSFEPNFLYGIGSFNMPNINNSGFNSFISNIGNFTPPATNLFNGTSDLFAPPATNLFNGTSDLFASTRPESYGSFFDQNLTPQTFNNPVTPSVGVNQYVDALPSFGSNNTSPNFNNFSVQENFRPGSGRDFNQFVDAIPNTTNNISRNNRFSFAPTISTDFNFSETTNFYNINPGELPYYANNPSDLWTSTEKPINFLEDIDYKGIIFFDYLRYVRENCASPYVQTSDQERAVTFSVELCQPLKILGRNTNVVVRKVTEELKESIIEDANNNNYKLKKIVFQDNDLLSATSLKGEYSFRVNVYFNDLTQKILKADYDILKIYFSNLKQFFYIFSQYKKSVNNTLLYAHLVNLYNTSLSSMNVQFIGRLLVNIGIRVDVPVTENSQYTISDIIDMYIKKINPNKFATIYEEPLSNFFDSIIVKYRKLLGIKNEEDSSGRTANLSETFELDGRIFLEDYNFICINPNAKKQEKKTVIKDNKKFTFNNLVTNGSYNITEIKDSIAKRKQYNKFVIDYSELFYKELKIDDLNPIYRDTPPGVEYTGEDVKADTRHRSVIMHVSAKSLEYVYLNLNLNISPTIKYFIGFSKDPNLDIINLNSLKETQDTPQKFVLKQLININGNKNWSSRYALWIDPSFGSFNPDYEYKNFNVKFIDEVE